MYLNQSCTTSLNLYCPSTGNSSGLCSCQPLYYYVDAVTGCVAKNSYLVACTSLSMCRTDLGLYCLSGVCNCLTYYYWSYASGMCSMFIFLKLISSYFIKRGWFVWINSKFQDATSKYLDNCTNPNAPCDPTLYLQCNTSNVPNVCMCQSGRFWYDSSCGKYSRKIPFRFISQL